MAASKRAAPYVPERGDLVWVDFSPHAGHEQGGRRPAIVISPRYYNGKAGLMLACPITSHAKSYPFEVQLPPSLPVQGVVLADHLRSIDFRARNVSLAGAAPAGLVDEVCAKLAPLVGA
jgi:mRNA interferase MazF